MWKLTQQLTKLTLSGSRLISAEVRAIQCCGDVGKTSFARCLSSSSSSFKTPTNQLNRTPSTQIRMNGASILDHSKPVSRSTVPYLIVPCQPMASLARMHRLGPPKKTRFNKKKNVLEGCPQKKGIVLKVIIKKPKKPNSANRKCVRVRLSNGKQIVAFVPGEGHNLQEHNMVLIQGGGRQDLPGVKHSVVRGKYDCNHIVKRTD